jgi:hypothetical protein
METRQCTRCRETKPLDQFAQVKRPRGRDGPDYYCRACRKEYNAIKYGDRRRGYALESTFEPRLD